MLPTLGLSLLLGASSAAALTLPFQLDKRAPPHGSSVRISNGPANASGSDPFGFTNINNNVYTGTIFVSGQPFIVQLDTGSSDLWLDTSNATLTDLTDTGVISSILYVDGTGAIGNVSLAPIQWGEFNVSQQAFINAPGSNATIGGEIQGLLGVGPPNLSQVLGALVEANSSANGQNFLDNVFSFYPSEPNFITFYLSRNDLGTIDGGEFTIGEVISNFSSITNSTQLPIVAPDEWVVLMDGVKINGQVYTGNSIGSPFFSIPTDKTAGILDTGTSLSTGPPVYVDAMYASVPGASFDGMGNYLLPCDTKVNVSIIFNGTEFPFHPIDLTIPANIDDDGVVSCQGTFSYTPDNAGLDFLLGDAFLRNVYALYDFGNWARVGDTPPFIQLLGTTDLEKAYGEFDAMNDARLQEVIQLFGPNGTETTSTAAGDSSAQPTPTDDVDVGPSTTAAVTDAVTAVVTVTKMVQPTAAATGSSKEFDAQGSLSDDSGNSVDLSGLIRNSYIIIGLLAGVIILLLFVLVKSFMKGKPAKSGKGYRTLGDPLPPQHEKPSGYGEYSTPYADGGH